LTRFLTPSFPRWQSYICNLINFEKFPLAKAKAPLGPILFAAR
jgi:hypothetical protein